MLCKAHRGNCDCRRRRCFIGSSLVYVVKNKRFDTTIRDLMTKGGWKSCSSELEGSFHKQMVGARVLTIESQKIEDHDRDHFFSDRYDRPIPSKDRDLFTSSHFEF